MVLRIEGFNIGAPLVVSPHVEQAGHRPPQSVDLGFQSGVPGDMPLPSQSILQAYIILNASRYRGPWVVTRSTLESVNCQSLQNVAGDDFNARLDSHLIVQFRIERNLFSQVRLGDGPVSALEVRAIRWTVKG